MQQKLIDKAIKYGFKENIIEMLKREEYPIKLLNQIYGFYSSHKEDVEDANVFFEICDFIKEIEKHSKKIVFSIDYFFIKIQ